MEWLHDQGESFDVKYLYKNGFLIQERSNYETCITLASKKVYLD